jgi:hypothetical protein
VIHPFCDLVGHFAIVFSYFCCNAQSFPGFTQ